MLIYSKKKIFLVRWKHGSYRSAVWLWWARSRHSLWSWSRWCRSRCRAPVRKRCIDQSSAEPCPQRWVRSRRLPPPWSCNQWWLWCWAVTSWGWWWCRSRPGSWGPSALGHLGGADRRGMGCRGEMEGSENTKQTRRRGGKTEKPADKNTEVVVRVSNRNCQLPVGRDVQHITPMEEQMQGCLSWYISPSSEVSSSIQWGVSIESS